MKLVNLLILIFLMACLSMLNAQTPKPPQTATTITPPNTAVNTLKLLPSDSVFVLVDGEQKFIQHTVKQGQTIYSIAQFYAVELSDIYYFNPLVAEKGSKVGSKLKIPISGRALRRSKGAGFVDSLYAKVYYKVKPSETFYRLSSVYFKMPVENIQKMNKLASDAVLQSGQVLHVAWLYKYGIPDSLRRYNGLTGVLLEKNNEHKLKYDESLKTKKEQLTQGAAYWQKGERFSDNSSLSVMYNGVAVGSVIRIENPMTGRTVYAKVIGSVPENSEVKDAVVVVSPTVAYALGGLDARFYVKVNWLK